MKTTRLRSVTISIFLAAVAFGVVASSPAAAQTRKLYRLTTLGLVDPQIWTALGANPCSGPLNLLVNGVINSAVSTCEPVTEGMAHPCNFDFNILAVFDPLDQTAGAQPGDVVQCMSGGQPCELQFAVVDECTRQTSSGPINCNGAPSNVISSTYSNGGSTATCLAGLPGTFGADNNGTNPLPVPATGNATNNCGVSGILELTLELGDGLITIPLKGAQLGARYNGNPATSLTTGLARGFLSETDADGIIIDVNMSGIVINAPLSELLPGGTDNCRTAATGQDDRDRNPPDSLDGELGWWFYLSFAATEVTAPEFPTPTATETMAPDDTPTPTLAPPTDTPASTATPSVTVTTVPTDTPELSTPTHTPVPTDTPTVSACPGDCNGDGMVPINEVQLTANVYLETANISACPAADVDNSDSVGINEVVQAARSFQFDCEP